MTLPAGFEYGFRTNLHDDVWCIRRDGADMTLCNRQVNSSRGVGYFPAAQPTNPATVCQGCRDAMWGAPPQRKERPVAYGICPVCGGREPMFEGRMQAHGSCPGVNMAPTVGR